MGKIQKSRQAEPFSQAMCSFLDVTRRLGGFGTFFFGGFFLMEHDQISDLQTWGSPVLT